MAVSLPKLSRKYPHLINSKFAYTEARALTNFVERNLQSICREFMVDFIGSIVEKLSVKSRVNFRKQIQRN